MRPRRRRPLSPLIPRMSCACTRWTNAGAPADAWGQAEMTLQGSFAAALDAVPGVEQPEVLPDRLAAAVLEVLDVAGAGLSFTLLPDRRVPVGSSSPDAAVAERLQFSLGEGPCLQAHHDQRLVSASAVVIGATWPVYAGEMVARTPFRSAAGIPVGASLGAIATLQLYGVPSRDVAEVCAEDVVTVADLVGSALEVDMARRPGPWGSPHWLSGRAARARYQVWLAIGYLNGQRGSTSAESLAILRAHAFRQDVDLETAAVRVLAGELPPA